MRKISWNAHQSQSLRKNEDEKIKRGLEIKLKRGYIIGSGINFTLYNTFTCQQNE